MAMAMGVLIKNRKKRVNIRISAVITISLFRPCFEQEGQAVNR